MLIIFETKRIGDTFSHSQFLTKIFSTPYRLDQEDFVLHEIWRNSIHLFAVLWNGHLVNYISLMHCYGINTSLLLLTFSRAKILITSCKILIITVIYNKTPNELTTYTILCRKVTILYRQGLASLFQVWEKLNSKKSFSSSCFIAGDIRVKVTCSHKIVFNGHAIPYFLREVYTVKFFFQSIS